MPSTIYSTSTSSVELMLYDKAMLSIDYGKLYWDFLKADALRDEDDLKEVDCYEMIKDIESYSREMLSVQSNEELLKSGVRSSSVLTDDIESIATEAINSALVYEALKLTTLDEIELEVVNRLRCIEQVIAIYTQKYHSELQIVVFLNTDKYDNELIHRMLDIEYELQKQFRDPLLAFSYIPNVYENRRAVVSKTANLIYEK